MPFIFDAFIYGFLAADIGFLLLLIKIRRAAVDAQVTRKKKLAFRALIFAAVFSWLVIFYGSFIEPRRIIVSEHIIALSAEPVEEFRIALVSDFHVGPYKKSDFVEKTVKKINAEKPDAVLIAGDSISGEMENAQYLAPLQELKAPLGVYAVLGNHDYDHGKAKEVRIAAEQNALQPQMVARVLQTAGVRVLKNKTVKLRKSKGTLRLTGIDEYWTGRAKIPEAALVKTANRSAAVLLGHNPDIVNLPGASDMDIVLAGHTHGGQIQLPVIGPVPNLPDALGRSYDRGLFEFGKLKLFITSGIGESGPRARLLVPPEIALLTIRF